MGEVVAACHPECSMVSLLDELVGSSQSTHQEHHTHLSAYNVTSKHERTLPYLSRMSINSRGHSPWVCAARMHGRQRRPQICSRPPTDPTVVGRMQCNVAILVYHIASLAY